MGGNSSGSDEPVPQGRLDQTTLRTIGRRAESHPLVESWRFQPDAAAPRYLEVTLDAGGYPSVVDEARLEIRWFVPSDYYVHYIEDRDGQSYQCRWDRHPKAGTPRTHFHPPPDAGPAVDSPLDTHRLDVLFTVLDWVREHVEALHQ